MDLSDAPSGRSAVVRTQLRRGAPLGAKSSGLLVERRLGRCQLRAVQTQVATER